MLRGFESMDKHFQSNDLTQNIPALLAMMHLWNRNFLSTTSHALIPYDYRMRHFPAYLQQLLMESCGKSVMRDGAKSALKTAPIYWGESGCNAQHSFFQLFHQGTDIIPIDFLLARNSIDGNPRITFDIGGKLFRTSGKPHGWGRILMRMILMIKILNGGFLTAIALQI